MADRKREKSSRRFAGVMLVYALLVAALTLAAVRPFWNYLKAYEESGSNKAMDRYIQSFDEAHIRAVSADFLNGLDLGLQNEQQAFDAVADSFRGTLRYSLKGTDADLRHATYSIRNELRELGTVTIGKEADPPMGFSPWEVEAERFDFSWLLGSDEITVPDSWTVSCNGTVLDESYRVGDAIPYELLKDFYRDSRFDLPYMVTYRVDRVLGKAPFSLTDAFGDPVDPAAELTEYDKLANCTEEEREQLTALLDGFLQRYIDCLSNSSHNVRGNYEALKPYILAGSDIDQRVYDNMAGQQWAHSKGDTVEERADKLLMDLGNGYYMADISYTLDTVGGQGHVKSVNDARIVMQMTENGPKVIEVYTY